MRQIVFLRHGESTWNKENRFTGWQDVDLSEKGLVEAKQAGQVLKQEGFRFDIAYCSVLKRALRTLWSVQDEMDLMWIPVEKSWRLNERHYGALTGLDKAETAAQHGEAQVKIWRRSYDTPPPLLSLDDPRHPQFDAKYQNVAKALLPAGESLKDTVARVLPIWQNEILPQMDKNKRILVVAHGNSLRALIQHIEKMSPEQIMEVNVPTGIPLVYELDDNNNFLSKRYLGDEAAVAAAMHSVAHQGKASTTVTGQ